ncbi:hypothetical protein STRCI_008549 [Streptomyces cinnabarinus]|uniref:Uncharacterized protein n=1 Tax=Streptomyces cinnabarinus TaxID=67287 RepID=A0ABY7KTN4_9ACTN|nr:hypothetical protein [Streptomyces cinnabarinus]WAZ26883.1 hypothetical protein STRCI_008549 [Streptomyces cinnabarinus]
MCSDPGKQAAYRHRCKAAKSPALTAAQHQPACAAKTRGYLLRAYDQVPQLPAPRREQGWFFAFMQRRLRRLTEAATVYAATPLGTGKRLPFVFINYRCRSDPGSYGALHKYRTARQPEPVYVLLDGAHRFRPLECIFEPRMLGAWVLGVADRRQPLVKPAPSLTSPLEALVPERGAVPRVSLAEAGIRRSLVTPSASGPPAHQRYAGTAGPCPTRRHVPAQRRRRRKAR